MNRVSSSTVEERMIFQSSWQVNPPQSRISVKAIEYSFQPRRGGGEHTANHQNMKEKRRSIWQQEGKTSVHRVYRILEKLIVMEKIVSEQQPQ